MRFPWQPKPSQELERATGDPLISLADYWNQLQEFNWQGLSYTLPGAPQEEITGAFTAMSQQAMKSDGVVFACMAVRMSLFSEASFQYRQIRNGKPGDLFGTPDLAPLETPWPNGTTGDMLSRMIQDADLAGNAFIVRHGNGVRRLRPDWVKIAIGSMTDPEVGAWDVDAEVLGYIYKPGGPGSRYPEEVFMREEVAHFAPYPDPEAQFRGMSWLTPVVREIMSDKAMTQHKLSFFDQGATPNLVIKVDTPDLDQFKVYQELFREAHEGAANAYKTIFLAAGADATVVGGNMEQIDFKQVQGAGETRIAAAAGVPPVIVGLSEGLQAATYSNYGQARRRFTDGTMSYLWRQMSGSLATIVTRLPGAELWYDASDIPFLKEDQKDAAEIQSVKSASIRTLLDAGFEAVSVIAAINADDFSRLTHTGLFSVQLQPPGTNLNPPGASLNPATPAPAPTGSNGNGRAEAIDDLYAIVESFRPQPVHVNVEPAQITTPEVRVEPQITVESARAPDVNVTVEPSAAPVVHVAAAPVPDVNVTVEAPPPAEVNVRAPDVNVQVDSPPPAEVNVTTPEVRVNVEPPPPAEVTVTTPEVRVNVEPPDVTVTTPDVRVNVDPPPPAEVNVTVEAPATKKRKIKVQRDDKGNATSYEEQ